MDRLRHSVAAVLMLLVLCGSAAAQTTGSLALPGKTKVLIGCVAPIAKRPTPSAAIQAGIRMAIADAAKTLGPNVEVTLSCEDSQGDAKGSAAAMEALVAKGAVGVIGDFTSSATLGSLAVADKAKVPLISASASSPALTKANDYFFRVVPNDLKQAAAAADMVAAAKAKSVAVLTDGSVYGKSLTTAFSDALKGKGGKVADTVTLTGADGVKDAVAAVEKSGADAVFFAMNDVAAAAAFITAASSMKWMLFAGDSIMDPDLYTAVGADAAMLLADMRGTGFTLGSAAFQASYTKFANAEPRPVGAHSYDAATLLIKAYTAAAAPKKGPQIAAALLKTRFTGAVGAIALDAAGDQTANKDSYSVYKFGPKGQLVVAK